MTDRLRARLRELQETLRAIRSGEVDALVVQTGGGDQVFTLKSADQTYRLMVEEMQAGAATLSHEGVLLYGNPFLAALLDVSLEDLLGAPVARFLDEAAADSMGSLLRAAESGVARGEIAFRQRDGTVSTHVSLTPLSLEGAPVFCMIVTDLTERKRREEERAQLEFERAARVAAEDANRKAVEEIERRKRVEDLLRQAERKTTDLLSRERTARTEAEQASRLKDEFLATVSHELRSPLNAIVAWSHLLSESALDEATAHRAAEAIERNARAQTRLVGDLLDVSRIVTGKFQVCLGPVRLAEVIALAADTVR
ncbi:MAG TPA: histidine kinase dimerization/phospho-acceptor domain-containing protein, partial [Vicinamibacteria bacterium]